MFTTIVQIAPFPVTHGDNAYLAVTSLVGASCHLHNVELAKHTYPDIGAPAPDGEIDFWWAGSGTWLAGDYHIYAECTLGTTVKSNPITVKMP